MANPAIETELQLSDNALTVLERRYLKKDTDGNVIERPEDMFRRVADNIASAEGTYGATTEEVKRLSDDFYGIMTRQEFMPNSPTLMNAGREFQQLSACFVLPVEDSMESIFQAVKDTAMIHKSGGGTGFSFSRLRPADDIVSSTRGVSSGPVSFMKVFDSATEAIKQGGVRRGANMAVLRVDHPDIEHFIEAKTDHSQLTNFNLSVGATEEFMRAVQQGERFDLINPRTGEVAGSLDAREIFHRMAELAWEGGDPGIIFLDRVNEHNPTPHVGEIEATNPCGEQPLLPHESCNLGSINLAKVVAGVGEGARIDWEKLRRIVHSGVHFLDNVIEMNELPLPQIAEQTRANRKIGLGVMGFSDLLILLGISYNSQQAVHIAEEVMRFVTDEARAKSRELADLRGAFPNWKGSVADEAGEEPMRNATVTTIAPTGTISMIAGCSSGVEPLFAVVYTRHVLDRDELLEIHPLFEEMARDRGFYSPDLMKEVAARGSLHEIQEIPREVRELFVTAHDISPEWHVRIQAAFQEFTDNAVSKTVNFPNDATVEDIEHVYRLAYELGCKGITVYRDGSRDEQVLRTGQTEKARKGGAEAVVAPRARPQVVTGQTRMVRTGCGKLYVTINSDESGPFELFATMGKAGGCAASQSEALARLVSLAFRCGIPAEQIVKQLKGISCHMPAWEPGGERILSCADAVAKAIQQCMMPEGEQLQMDFNGTSFGHTGACPECGGTLVHEGGCNVCRDCGYSQCD
ncbi:MAG: vitamin B12-dependent ribonucleotide reductase [candidate division WS1 bacterium]|jgi:ribonucleoside-diphosphate reductase alpha chain|nr:vitamin B12-dependent ribonucleotide reductase [candidate division WS1 bacterium]